ncbi:MAG: acyl-CoA thioesterase [Methanobacteriota archaeon]|nr:MAG: acyl-CoA thioesterase [Euryarchaeota archaeon]
MTMLEYRFSPRFSDLDSYGHVNNAVYATYFEMLRTQWLKHEEWKEVLDEHGTVGFVIVHLEIDFLSPIFFDNEILGKIYVSRIGGKSWDFSYELINPADGSRYATGLTTQVLIDRREGRSIRLPQETIDSLQKYHLTPPAN